MTNSEIEKALACCSKGGIHCCDDCPLIDEDNCPYYLIEQAYDYINRLKEEKYQLEQKFSECENGHQGAVFAERCKSKSGQDQIQSKVGDTVYVVDKFLKYQVCEGVIEKQAVKEFAEKIKDWLHGADLYFYNGQEEFILDDEEINDKIDDLIKELYGEDDNG